MHRISPNYRPGLNYFQIGFDPALLWDGRYIEYENECKTSIQMRFDPALVWDRRYIWARRYFGEIRYYGNRIYPMIDIREDDTPPENLPHLQDCMIQVN